MCVCVCVCVYAYLSASVGMCMSNNREIQNIQELKITQSERPFSNLKLDAEPIGRRRTFGKTAPKQAEARITRR